MKKALVLTSSTQLTRLKPPHSRDMYPTYQPIYLSTHLSSGFFDVDPETAVGRFHFRAVSTTQLQDSQCPYVVRSITQTGPSFVDCPIEIRNLSAEIMDPPTMASGDLNKDQDLCLQCRIHLFAFE